MFRFAIARFEQALDRGAAPALIAVCLFVTGAFAGF